MPASKALTLPRQRAMDAEEKDIRRNAILDAAERLFIQHPDRLANVAEVASAAGLAKGTVYLYFPSKEELLLALHERHSASFFNDFFTLLAREEPVTIDDILAVTNRNMVDVPAFLPLAALCLGTMSKSIPPQVQLRFHLRIAQWVNGAGERLERHFPALAKGQGATFLLHSYAVIVGLWQMLQPDCVPEQFRAQPELSLFLRDYKKDLDQALRALLEGHLRLQSKAVGSKTRRASDPRPSKTRKWRKS